MTARIELAGRDLLIRFDYDRRLVEAVRLLPNRRFDSRMRTWIVPARHVDVVVEALLPFGFDLAPEVRGLARPVAATLPFVAPPAPPPVVLPLPAASPPAAASPPPAPSAWTIGSLNRRVRDALRGAFVDSVWVVGEMVDFDKSAGRRHRHFTLVEKAAGEARPIAQVEAVLFADTLAELAHKLEAAQPPLLLRDGIEIRVRARVDLYPQSGRFQLVIEDIDPEHTLGKLALTREQILRELRASGLAGRNLARPMPRPALRVAVLASPSSDGWHDFLRQLQAARLSFELTLFPVRVQGVELRRTVLAGLAHFAARTHAHDVVCILRGGGARGDLSWFDDRALAHAVACHPLKILVGIGHERDQTVLDHIAESFKTPTALAAWLAAEAGRERACLDDLARRLLAASPEIVDARRQHLRRVGSALRTALAQRLVAQRHALALAAQRLRHAALVTHATSAQKLLALAAQRLRHLGHVRLERARTAVVRNGRHLQDRVLLTFERSTSRLDAQELRCRLLDPRLVLRRGYAMVRRKDGGRVVTDAAALTAGSRFCVEFRDGRVEAEAEAVTIRTPPPPP